jgi:hypothetical protein
MWIEFSPCPETRKAAPYLLGRLPQEKAMGYEEHYFVCSQCKCTLEAYDAVMRGVAIR